MRKILPILLGIVLSFITIPNSSADDLKIPRAAVNGIVVNQGDVISVAEEGYTSEAKSETVLVSNCTVGYIDKKTHRAYTAAHCGKEYSTVANSDGIAIGTFMKNNHDNTQGYRNDQAYVQLYTNVSAGDNKYSGDTIIDYKELSTGDDICSYGAKSGRIHCGKIRGVDKSNIIAGNGAGGIPGDSGGPAWMPGKGFLGVYTSYNNYANDYIYNFTPLFDYYKDSTGEKLDATPNVIENGKEVKNNFSDNFFYKKENILNTLYFNTSINDVEERSIHSKIIIKKFIDKKIKSIFD